MRHEEDQRAQDDVARETRFERNRGWRQGNRGALQAYAREVEREGLPLARFRTF